MDMEKFPKTAQGEAVECSEEDIQRDELGFTNPNLHRRIDNDIAPEDEKEVKPRTYNIGVWDGQNSYRTEHIYYHDEESTTCEIP